MDVKKKHVLVGKQHVYIYDQELIYGNVIGLIASDTKFDDMLAQ